MDVLMNLAVVIISQCMHILHHRVVYTFGKKKHIVKPKYIQFVFVSHNSVKLEKNGRIPVPSTGLGANKTDLREEKHTARLGTEAAQRARVATFL